ncbi:acyltransferase family protein, partial [Bacteroidota bacterium]
NNYNMGINSVFEKKERLVSLDFFRGAAILLMILANNVGSEGYSFLRHAAWNGWTLADTVFPFFIWIIGVAIVFSFTKRISKGHTKKSLFSHVLKRSAIILALGLFLNLFPYFNFSAFRISGVLQLIAVTYFCASMIFIYTKPKWHVILTVLLLLSSGLLLKFAPVPNYGSGILEPGKNFAHNIDSMFLKGHMWEQTETWDPEGIFSIFSAISTMLLGIITGHLLIGKKNNVQKTKLVLLSGIVLVIIGYIINIWVPINKSLWTSSFSLFMSGLASVIFAVSYWVIDVKKCKKWSFPFVICGLNAITLYLFSGIISKLLFIIHINEDTLYTFINHFLYLQIATPKNASLLFALTNVLLIYLVAYFMYKKKIFIKI